MPKVEVKVRNLSGFDKSYKNLLTSKCGTLTPILVDELIPGTKVNLKQVISASLPPLASDTYMNVNLKVEAFFVPHRLLYGAFWDWMTHNELYDSYSGDYEEVGIPCLAINPNETGQAPFLAPGSLADYLGIRSISTLSSAPMFYGNIFPFLAYHRIYDDWYRHPLVQTPVFCKPMNSTDDTPSLSALPFSCVTQHVGSGHGEAYSITSAFPDGKRLGSLRQRNFGFDYFTVALPDAQLGSAQGVDLSLTVSGSAASGKFTIAALRAANSMQQFAERNEMAGPRQQDYIKAHYGVELSSGVAQRAILLGSGEIPVYSKGISANSNYDDQGTDNGNPFRTSVGAMYGNAVCSGQLDLIDNFEAQESGVLMVIASLVPKVTYSSGIDRMFYRFAKDNTQSDLADAILENVGMQPIYCSELTGKFNSVSMDVFGYSDRYADWKHKNDELHGLLRDGQSLQSFALQRSVQGYPTIGTDFLAIPTDFMDQVASIASSISSYGFWLDCFNNYKVAMPLSSYAIPSLQDPAFEHGKSVGIDLGGSRL